MKIFKRLYYKILCQRIIKQNIDYQRDKNEDRHVLEAIIFPYLLANWEPKTIFDIGREDYQHFYNDFFTQRELWTLDIDEKRRKYGSKGRHIIDNAANIGKYFPDNYFDIILMNGVFGWGLDKDEEIQKCFLSIAKILKPGGLFVFGYNDDIIPLKKINGLKLLRPHYFKPLKSNQFKCSNGDHTYNFFSKK